MTSLGRPVGATRVTHRLYGCSFDAVNRFVLTMDDGSVGFCNLETDTCLLYILGHRLPVLNYSESLSGSMYATVSMDGTARIWDTRTNQSMKVFLCNLAHMKWGVFSPDGLHFAIGGGLGIEVWDMCTERLTTTVVPMCAGRVMCCAYYPDGHYMVIGVMDLLYGVSAVIWDMWTNTRFCALHGHTGAVTGCTVMPDHTVITVSQFDPDGRIKFWDGTTGQHLRTIITHRNILVFDYLINDDLLVIGSDNNVLKIWNMVLNECVGILQGPTDSSGAEITGTILHKCAWSTDGTRVGAVYNNRTSLGSAAYSWHVPLRLRNCRVKLLLMIVYQKVRNGPRLPAELWEWMYDQQFFT